MYNLKYSVLQMRLFHIASLLFCALGLKLYNLIQSGKYLLLRRQATHALLPSLFGLVWQNDSLLKASVHGKAFVS